MKFNSTICSVFSMCRCCTVSSSVHVEEKETATTMPIVPPARDLEEASAPRSCWMRETKQKGTFWKDSEGNSPVPPASLRFVMTEHIFGSIKVKVKKEKTKLQTLLFLIMIM